MSMSFRKAQEEFQNHPTPENADEYWNAAHHYWDDGEIGADTYEAAVDEITAYWHKD